MRFAIYSALGAACFGGVAHGNLVVNGSFELAIVDPGAGFVALGAGSGVIDGWDVVGTGVDYIGTVWAASDGGRSIDLNNLSLGGGIEQSFATVVGEVYFVEFDLSANMFAGPEEKVMRVSAAGVSEDFVYNYVDEESTPEDPMWRREGWSFVATDTSSTVRFLGVSSGSAGASIDNVVVSVVPAPGGVVAVGLAGVIGIRRRR